MAKRNKIISYEPWLKKLARELRKNSTKAELLLWQQIRTKQLNVEFHRQVPIANFIVDFYCHELKLAIEVDGFTHYNEGNHKNDLMRQTHLESLGVIFLRFDDEEVKKDLLNVLRTIEYKIVELNAG
ncbi:endonuclease domain-containing protein [Solitalea sp. MAHUQ-68]|uniref:Endonuclease domain-containing protein n=1 Tax=Solitalea agri TaxID=2953739 RepID=A0A9X2F8H6_9SPHI|nr:endonuclease domain-containing protein [Solitalea agri]MCO4293688.1 endonuclease domain-containing protein [Solitalea agri]